MDANTESADLEHALESATMTTDPVRLSIEYVAVSNDNIDRLGSMGALAAIAYDEGEHQGLHFLVPCAADRSAAEAVLRDLIAGSGFAYEIVLRTKTGKVLTDADIEALADEAEQGYDVEALKGRPNRAKCPDCEHFWHEHDSYGCHHQDGCLRIDRHRRYDKANNVAVDDEAVYPSQKTTQRYVVDYSAIYDVICEVDATSPEEAIAKVMAGEGRLTDEAYDRPHPDTEFFAHPAEAIVQVIAERYRAGIDCTEDESAVIKRHFDQYASEAEAEQDELASLFTAEYAEWCEDMENGRRPQNTDVNPHPESPVEPLCCSFHYPDNPTTAAEANRDAASLREDA